MNSGRAFAASPGGDRLARPFLTAEWKYLAMLNYEIDPVVLERLVPRGTELDRWQGRTLVTVVGFLFLNTKVMGVAVPLHRNFEEVNLRFYVRRWRDDRWERGVVFVKEIVPKLAIATIARFCYNENYVALPMRHELEVSGDDVRLAYGWKTSDRWNEIRLSTQGPPRDLEVGSEEEFITEHYWGYTVQRNGGTIEYQVEHPRWRTWAVQEAVFECDVEAMYGRQFRPALSAKPASVFLAEGSPVTVRRGIPCAAC